jgi:hypothetical protein
MGDHSYCTVIPALVTTCNQGPLGPVPKVAKPYVSASIKLAQMSLIEHCIFITCHVLPPFRTDTKLAILDHITSVHALVLPIKVRNTLHFNASGHCTYYPHCRKW